MPRTFAKFNTHASLVAAKVLAVYDWLPHRTLIGVTIGKNDIPW